MLAPLLLLLASAVETVPVRGVPQKVVVYRPDQPRDLPPVVLSGGDAGWFGFIAEAATKLASRGHLVVGINTQAYLSGLSKNRPLEPAEVGQDYGAFIRFARTLAGGRGKVLLAGWSEGAGLSLLAAADKQNQPYLAGLITLGLPEQNELAWRFQDSIIFLTRKVPHEKTFSSKDYIVLAAPVPLVMIQSTRDDFVPLATARELYRLARDPKQFHLIEASNHRFSGNRAELYRRLGESIEWALQQ